MIFYSVLVTMLVPAALVFVGLCSVPVRLIRGNVKVYSLDIIMIQVDVVAQLLQWRGGDVKLMSCVEPGVPRGEEMFILSLNCR